MDIIRKLLIFMAVLMSIVSTSLAASTTADAASANANGYVYAVAPQWWSWCPGRGNYVTFMYFNNHTTGRNGGDAGDDVVYIPVVLGQSNTVSVSVQCRWSTPQGWKYSIAPRRTNQTFFFGYPGGAWTSG